MRPKYVDLINAVVPRSVLPFRLTSPEALFHHAERRAGVRPAGVRPAGVRKAGGALVPDALVWAGFQTLFRSYVQEARLHALGEAVMAFNLIALMETRLRLMQDAITYPDIGKEVIREPVIITGLPRTGSTLLHELLSMDQRFTTPLSWQVMFPSPPPAGRDARSQYRSIRRTDRRFLAVYGLNPHFRQVHELKAAYPQECICMQATAFLGTQFINASYVPSYQAWWEATDTGQSYEYHRAFLQQLQYGLGAPGQWLLKAPSHLLTADHLVAAYPDARIIQTHRPLDTVLGSIASLQRHLYTAFSDFDDNLAIGELVTGMWQRGLARMQSLRDARPDLAPRMIDIDYQDVVDDPIAVVASIYTQWGWVLTDATRHAMQGYLADHPQHKHGTHSYDAADFGIAPGADGVRS